MIDQRFIRRQGERNKALTDEALKPLPAPEELRRKVLDQIAEAEAIAAAARTMSAVFHSSVIGAPSSAERSAPSAA